MAEATMGNAAAPLRAVSMPERPSIQIVPVAAVPVVVVVLGALVVSIAGNWLWALDFFHIVGGVLWTGVDLFVGFVIGPIVGSMSVQARAQFMAKFMPRMLLLMPTLVTMTLASGWQLARHLNLLAVGYPQHWWFVASFAVVGVMSVVALGVLEPANLAVLFEMRKPHPNGERIGRLMKRFIYTAGITGVMQVAILVIMTKIATW